MEENRWRHELKHTINMGELFALRQRLRAVANADRYANEAGEYRIRSLYFDTAGDRALRQKLDGVDKREKFRIRFYNFDTGFIRLEKKIKQGGLCLKRSAALRREDCARLLDGELDWMQKAHPLVAELYRKMQTEGLRPRTIVDYIREPFVYGPGNVRVTLDRDVRTGLQSRDFFNKDLPTVSAGPAGLALVEVKFDAFLPSLIRDVVQLDRQATSYSKYAACRIYG